jgi:phage shock protein C
MAAMSERLYRSRTDRILAGVCGGLAERLGVDPSLIRIAWVVLALATAVVPFVVLYVVMAVIVPERPAGDAGPPPSGEGEAPAGVGSRSGRARSEDLAVLLGAGLVVVGLVVLLDRWFWIRVDWQLVWPAVLIVIGVLLILQTLRRPA